MQLVMDRNVASNMVLKFFTQFLPYLKLQGLEHALCEKRMTTCKECHRQDTHGQCTIISLEVMMWVIFQYLGLSEQRGRELREIY